MTEEKERKKIFLGFFFFGGGEKEEEEEKMLLGLGFKIGNPLIRFWLSKNQPFLRGRQIMPSKIEEAEIRKN